jgi:serine/threonine-protein kinase RsbW
MKNNIVVPVNIESLSLISEFLQEKSILRHLPSRKMWEILLAVDEICCQIIDIINNDQSEVNMNLIWENKEDKIIIKIQTECFAFNPMEVEEDFTKNNEEHVLEGMELSLIKQMVDKVYYLRKNNQNILIIEKLLKSKRNKCK